MERFQERLLLWFWLTCTTSKRKSWAQRKISIKWVNWWALRHTFVGAFPYLIVCIVDICISDFSVLSRYKDFYIHLIPRRNPLIGKVHHITFQIPWSHPQDFVTPFQTGVCCRLVHIWACTTSQLSYVQNSNSKSSCVWFPFVSKLINFRNKWFEWCS